LKSYHLTFWLTHSKGFKTIIKFTGLDCPFRIIPSLPSQLNFFTRQPYYFLEDIEAIGCLDFPYGWNKDPKDTMAIADNYLFQYSLRNPESRLTARSYEAAPYQPWKVDENKEYLRVDNDHIEFREPSLISEMESHELVFFYRQRSEVGVDGEVIRPFNELYEVCREGFEKFLESKSSEGKIRLNSVPYAAGELEAFFFIDLPHNTSKEEVVEIFKSYGIDESKFLPFEFIECHEKYNQTLLEFYFAALRDVSPLTEFKNYYNIIEYFFEEAAIQKLKADLKLELCGRMSELPTCSDLSSLKDLLKNKIDVSDMDIGDYSKEMNQMRMVLKQYVRSHEISCFLLNLNSGQRNHFKKALPGFDLKPLNHGDSCLVDLAAERIYQIRNGIFHSKKGQDSIIPFSQSECLVRSENLLLKFIAQRIILSTGTAI